MEGQDNDDLINNLLKQQDELRELQENKSEEFKTGDPERDNNGFYLNFQGKGAKFETSRMKFLKTDKIKIVREHYFECFSGGGEKKDLSLSFIDDKTIDENTTLEDLGISASKTFTATFSVHGGLAQLQERIRLPNFRDEKRIKPSLKSDCIMGYDSKKHLRVEMPCGHVFAPLTMFQYIKMLSENVHKNLTCPKCSSEWEFEVMSAAADLSKEEKSKYGSIFTTRFQKKKGLIKQCPNCQEHVIRPKNLTMFRVNCAACKSRDFCWSCSKPWSGSGMTVCANDGCSTSELNKTLSSCKMCTPMGLDELKVPSIRACPRCLTIVRYKDACKHMKCWGCHKRFCFVCLGLEDDKGNWPCTNSYNYKCNVAPIQVLK